METAGTYTYADLEAMPMDNVRREIIDGDLIVSPSPFTRHQVVLGRLYLPFANHVAAHGGAQVFFSPLDCVFSERNSVQPDLIVVPDEQVEIITKKNIQGVPALLVEIVSDQRYDRVRKRDLYAKFGVPRYWLVEPEADRIDVCVLEGDRYGKPEIFEPGDILTLDLLPGFQIDVAKLFER